MADSSAAAAAALLSSARVGLGATAKSRAAVAAESAAASVSAARAGASRRGGCVIIAGRGRKGRGVGMATTPLALHGLITLMRQSSPTATIRVSH